MAELMGYEMRILIFTLIYNIIIIYFQFYSDKHYRQMYFIAHNFFYVSFDLNMLIFVPLKHLIFSERSSWSSSQDKNVLPLDIYWNQPNRHVMYACPSLITRTIYKDDWCRFS